MIAERGFGEEEAAVLLTQLTTEGLGPQITHVGLVEGAAHLNEQRRVRIRSVEAVGNRNDPDALHVEVHQDTKSQERTASEARQVVDHDNIEAMVASSGKEAIKARPAPANPRDGLVGVDVIVKDGDPAVARGRL